MRAGDADRQAAVDRLTEHLTAGRLDLTEFDQRIAKAYAATYLDELPELFTDLPDIGGKPSKGGRSGNGDGHRGFATATPWSPGAPGAGTPPGSSGGMSGRPGGYPARPRLPQMPTGSIWAGRFWRLIVVAIMVMVVLGLLLETRGFILLPLLFIGMGAFRGGGRRGGPWAGRGRPPWR
jgi:hypothetical protein